MPDLLLETITDTVGGDALSVLAGDAAAALALSIQDVLIHDTAEEFAAGAGDLLLAVGTTADAVVALVAEATRHGVLTVVVRDSPAMREAVRALGDDLDVAVLALTPEIGWARFTGQVRALLATDGAPQADGWVSPHRDLVAFANALCASVGGSVMIFNPQQEVLAASKLAATDDPMRRQAVLDQRGPAWYRNRLRERGVYRRLWHSGGVVDVAAVPERGVGRRLAVAVRDGEDILGSIWVAEQDTPLAADAVCVLGRAAVVAGQYLSARGPRAQTGRRATTETIARRLLGGQLDEEVTDWLDLDPHRPAAVLSCVFADERQRGERRFGDLLAVHLGSIQCAAVQVPSRGRLDIVLCELTERSADRLLDAARDVVTRASRTMGAQVIAAIGPVVPTLWAVPDSRAEADLILRVLRERGRTGTSDVIVSSIADVGASADVLALADLTAELPRFAHGPVPDLLTYDREHGTAYAASLAAYLDAFGDVITAAGTLHVHPNTLRYRLRRMNDLCGIDLTDPDQRLVASLHLRRAGLADPTTSVRKARTTA